MRISFSIKEYLQKIKYSYDHVQELQVDASKRKYFRISNKNNTNILVDSSLEKNSLKDFIKMSNWLDMEGFSSPRIYDANLIRGYSIMEDFGDNKFSNLFVKEKENRFFMYSNTIDLLSYLSKKELPSFLKPFSKKIFNKELSFFLDWYKYYNKIKNKNEVSEWNKIWSNLYEEATIDKLKTVVLRDFHIDNLFLLKNRKGIKKIGLIDFQDALIGHPAYDLVSLLQDVRITISSLKERELLELYISKNNSINSSFKISYIIFGTQRLIKIIGIFKRLEYLYGKKKYLIFLPRTLELLKRNLKNPIFKDLDSWFENYGY